MIVKMSFLKAHLLALVALAPLVTNAQGAEFVPLTSIPGLTGTAESARIEVFLNNLYRLCIGAAAIIAVFQIMRAGIMRMVGDVGMAEVKESNELIRNSVLGLILVLSPTIVFGIINRDILNLRINIDPIKTQFGNTDTSSLIKAPINTSPANADSLQALENSKGATGTVAIGGLALKKGEFATKAEAEKFATFCTKDAVKSVLIDDYDVLSPDDGDGPVMREGKPIVIWTQYCEGLKKYYYYEIASESGQSQKFFAPGGYGEQYLEFKQQCAADGGEFDADDFRAEYVTGRRVTCPQAVTDALPELAPGMSFVPAKGICIEKTAECEVP
jgi:hypothetical protein